MKSRILIMMHVLVFTAALAFGQPKIYQIKADSVRIFSSCDTAELILQNRSRNVQDGVLTNKGNGVTEFRKLLVKLNDDLYTVGGDTLHAAGKNIYNSDGIISTDRLVDGNNKNIQFKNNGNFLVANNGKPIVLSRSPVDSITLGVMNNAARSPYSAMLMRGTGCDATLELVSDTAGTCNAAFAIDFTTMRPRNDSWLTNFTDAGRHLLGRIQLQTSNPFPDFSALKFAIKSDTAFFKDGAYTLFTPGTGGGFTPSPVMTINPSYKNFITGFHTKMPYVQVNGGLFVGYGRNWYYNSRNANDIITGVDDVAGSVQSFYETRFSVYADSLPLKIYKLPAIKGSAFLSYSPARTADGNNVAFEYKDSVYEEIRQYISVQGLTTPSDLNLKENVTVSAFDVDKLLRLSIRDFNYKTDKTKTRHTGLIAQELKSQVPVLVTGEEGHYSIDYIKMVPYLLKAIQEQRNEIIVLKKQQAVTDHAAGTSAWVIQVQQLQEQLQQQQLAIKTLTDKMQNN